MANTNEIAQLDAIYKKLTELNATISKMAADYLALLKTIEAGNKTTKESAQNYDNLNKSKKQTAQTDKELDALDKQLAASEKKLQDIENGRIKQLIEYQIEIKKKTDAIRENITGEKAATEAAKAAAAEEKRLVAERKEAEKAATAQAKVTAKLAEEEKKKAAIDALSENSLVKMKMRLKELTDDYDKAGVRTKTAADEINKLSREIGKAEEATNRHQRGVGGYRDQLEGLKTSVMNGSFSFAQMGTAIASVGRAAMAFFLTPVGAIVGILGAIVMAGRSLINNSLEFSKAASNLSALTGQTGKDMDFLKDKAREFSKHSTESATEILNAFTIVGSAIPALLKNGPLLAEVTESAIKLSEATGGKLSIEEAAKATGSVMNQFRMNLETSNIAVNALAAGSLAGSVRVEELSESFRTGGAVMANNNMTMQQSIAALETLGTATLKGSDAGTAMKTVIMNLQKANKGFESGQFDLKDALQQVNKELDAMNNPIEKANYQADVFGKRGILAGTILRTNIPVYENFTKAVTGTNTAFDQANIQMDNLPGSYKLLGNAWKGLLLTIEDGNGILVKMWRGLVDFSTWILNVNTAIFGGISKIMDLFRSKETIARNEEVKKQKAAEEEKRAQLEFTLKSLGISLDKKATIADMEAAIAKKLAENKEAIDAETEEEAKKSLERKLKSLEIANKKEIVAIQDKYIKGIITQEQYNSLLLLNENKTLDEKIKLYKKDSSEYVELMGKKSENNVRSFEDYKKEREKYKQEGEKSILEWKKTEEKKLDDAEKLRLELFKNNNKINADQVKEDEKIAKEKQKRDEDNAQKEIENRKDVKEASIQLARDSINAVFEIQNMQFEKELDDLDKKKEKELSNKNLTEAQKAKIEADYEKKAAVIKTKQAQQSKVQALFDIAIGTAVSIMNAKGNLPLMIILAAMGAVQAAVVAARPIPKYAKGTQSAEREGIFGEVGRELMQLRSGQTILAEKATYFEGNRFKGARIYSNPETEKILNYNPHNYTHMVHDDRIIAGLEKLNTTLKNKPVAIYDRDHRQIGIGNSNHQTIYLNRLINRN